MKFGNFKVFQLKENLYQIQNDVDNCCTLVIGEKKALLFDTMCGLGDLRGLVESLTSLPVIVVNSHGHFDHMGGNRQFEEVYLNAEEWSIVENTRDYLEMISQNMGRDLSETRPSYYMMERIRTIEEGMTFDLGGVTAEAIALPGHTPGCIGLLLKELRTLLVGDALSPQMCLFFPESLELEVYQNTLQKVMGLDFDCWIQGHFPRLFSRELILKLIECTALPGKKRGFEYINTNIPEYHGLMYILEFRNDDAGGIVCLIGKEERHAFA